MKSKGYWRYVIKETNEVIIEFKDHGDSFKHNGATAVKCKSEYPRKERKNG